MNIPTRKKDDELMMERYDPNDKAYKKRTPKVQAEYDEMKAGFKKNSENHHEKNKEEREARGIKAPSDSNWYNSERTKEREDAEDESVEDLLKNQKENKLVWTSSEPKLWTAVSIESGEPKGYYADVIAVGNGKLVASVFDCINIARDEARANGEDFDEEGDTAQHLADFIEDYSATSYTQEIEDAEDVEDELPTADHDAPEGGIGSRSMDEAETLTDQFIRFASKVSALEEGRPVDVDALRLELNTLDAKLEALGSTDGVEDAEDPDSFVAFLTSKKLS